MKFLSFWIIFVCSTFLFSQGTYLHNESGFKIGADYGRVNPNYQSGINISLSPFGYFDISYSYSKIHSDENIGNSMSEYLARIYFLKKNKIFYSGSIGFMDWKANDKIWGFTVKTKLSGVFFEGGLHLPLPDLVNQKGLISVFYRYSEPTGETSILDTKITDRVLRRTLTFDTGFIYNLSFLSIIAGPRIIMEIDAIKSSNIGLKVDILLKH